ncbi:MAG TPA: prepilin-type N-terminal cleavage/methylation domain-containing protein [Chitinophagaceae bacterium]|nr:prepilin-type N-terminal cleavage/methylation domain-containing protein [Chitinophagaceae bacterium]
MKKQQGFTLMEAVIVVALLGFLMVVITQFFLGSNRIYQNQTAELGVNFSARSALDDIDAQVRQASQTLGTYDIHTAGPDVLILEIPAVNASNQLVPAAYDHIVYYMNGTNLMKQVYGDPASVRQSQLRSIGQNISTVNFTYNHADYAQVTQVDTSLNISSSAGLDTRTLNISSKSYIRN